jgi:hypothetical protein
VEFEEWLEEAECEEDEAYYPVVADLEGAVR